MKVVWIVLSLLLLGAVSINAIAHDAPPPEMCAPTVLDGPVGFAGLEDSAGDVIASLQEGMLTTLASGVWKII